ncbi:MAG TPA: TolC family protein [Gemmatimonadaceae bacterium]|nr:TolC family protein [Gemmatimonadaceae bacterium]
MLVLLALFQIAVQDSLPSITLAETRSRAVRLDPRYIAATGEVDNAQWTRRAAFSALALPSLFVSTDATRYSAEIFNIGTGRPQSTAVNARIDARYDFSLGGRQLADLSRSRASVEAARAGELQARFDAELDAESDYYAVLADQELTRVARERVRRADEALVIARARVASGAAVQSDSLQLRLELNRARVALLRQDAALRVSRLQLGRRVGMDGALDAQPLDTLPAPELPLSLDQAVTAAFESGPAIQTARANESAADAAFRSQRGSYLPTLSLSAASAAFDDTFFPEGTSRSSLTLSLSFPIWNGGQRELAVSEARVGRDITRATRLDLERATRRDVTELYDEYGTARAATELAVEGVLVARENFRVQDRRYRAGAASILDLLEGQLRLAEAEAELVQSRYSTRLALAQLERLLGRRLFESEGGR